MATMTLEESTEQHAHLVTGDALGQAVVAHNLQHGFTQCPDAVFFHPTLSRRAKLVFAALLKHCRQKDYCWPSQETLAQELSMSVDTVQRGLRDLRSYVFRTDPETGRLLIEPECPACTEHQQKEPDPQKRRHRHCDQHQAGLVEWKQRGLNKTNFYRVVPLYSPLEELRAHLTESAQEPSEAGTQEDTCGKPHKAVLGNRTMQDQETAPCGTNHIEEKHTQGNNGDSNSNGSAAQKGTGFQTPEPYSHIARGTIRNENEVEENPSQSTPIESNPPSSKEEKMAGAAPAKEVEEQRIGEYLSIVRGLAAAGISPEQWQEVETAISPAASADRDRPSLSPTLRSLITSFSQDLYDEEHGSSNQTRVARIYQFCQNAFGDDEEKFVEFLYDARAKAKKAAMQDRNAQGKPARMKYFFTCLERETGYRQPCPRCTKEGRAEPSQQAEIGYHWQCGCGHDFTLDVH